MAFNYERRLIIRFASILGMLQAATWSIMAIIAIAIFFDQPKLSIDRDTSYSRYISLLLYSRYLFKPDDDVKVISNMIIGSREFHVFMWFYLAFNLFWLLNSYRLYSESRISAHHPMQKVTKKMKFWTANTILICLLDFIFVCFLARDYDHCYFKIDDAGAVFSGTLCHLTGGIVLTIAAKGFFLWFLNFGLALTIRKIRMNMTIAQQRYNAKNRPSLYLSIPRIPEGNAMQPALSPYNQGPVNYGEGNQQPINSRQLGQPGYFGQSVPQTNYGSPTNFGNVNSPSRF